MHTPPAHPAPTSQAPGRAPGAQAEAVTRFTRNVAPGVHRLQHAYVNCYLIEGDSNDGLTLVDTAFPATWPILLRALSSLGRTMSDVQAVVLTHAHFDHLGFAARIEQASLIPIHAHPAEAYIARHPYRYAHERARAVYPLRHPAAIPVLTRMAGAGALRVRGISTPNPLDTEEVLDVPGRPHVVFSPGHTFGHCAFHLPDRDVLLTGDALVTFDPYTGASGPQIVSGAATADSVQALQSLTMLEQTGATTVLPGHGQPWRHGIAEAARLARTAGPS